MFNFIASSKVLQSLDDHFILFEGVDCGSSVSTGGGGGTFSVLVEPVIEKKFKDTLTAGGNKYFTKTAKGWSTYYLRI